jgi:ketosteroid isomerase-like protein
LSIPRDEIFHWLDSWQQLINSGEYETARPLFADDVVAFGTVTSVMQGLADLESRQWRQVWYRIKDFTFDKDTATILSDPGANTAIVCCLWHSLGKTQSSWYERRGRVTLVLKRQAAGLACVHSHFSMEPGIPPVADGS